MTGLDDLEVRLLTAAQERRDALIDFCSRLIQTRSVNGVDDEQHIAQVIADEASALGLTAQLAGEDPRRPNVIVSVGAGESTGLLLLGHLDTVPAGDEARWSAPPFGGVARDGRIYGRGAVDTKSGMAASLYALAILQAVPGALPGGRAQFIGVPDEESGATGTLGIRWLHDRGLLGAAGAIYAYSGDQITLGHRGLLRYKLACEGQSIHTGAAAWQDGTAGANAVTGMARLLLALEELRFEHSRTPYFETFRTVMTPGTIIQGGFSINIVPDQCEALIDIRLTPEFDRDTIDFLLDEAMAKVERERPGVHFTSTLLNYAPAAITREDARVVRALESVVRDVRQKAPERVVAGPANEGYLLIERGIPTICGFGPQGANFHAVDEYVEIESLVETAAMFAITARRMGSG
ncbi:MAG: M20/M25/M40 family metallo-hydrolase [Anaerolineae bacterium]|nr:M20/M25/M40 family metallo-hydrolase [Anaerolineae bacterium]